MEIRLNKIINIAAVIIKPFIRVFSLTIIFSMVLSSNINAQTLERHQVITAYIYNFANNIQWQNEEAIMEFQFLIIGEDKNVFNEMKTLSNTKTLRGKSINIVSKLSVDNIDGVHLIYITKDQEHSLTELFDKIEGKNILLISDNFQDKRLIMINFVEGEKETIHFEINRANIINQNLSFNEKIVFLGGTEIDVAALYREGQQSLRSLQKHTVNLENDLVGLEHTITSKSQEVQVQKDSLDRQALQMLAQHDSLNKQTLKIQEQQKTLSDQSQLLEEKQINIRTQDREIQEQQNILDDQYLESEKQKEELNKGKALLREQQDKILSQTKTLEEKTGTIDKQQNILYLLVIITTLVIILVFLIYYGYKNKQKLNRVLESKVKERTNDLRITNEKLLAELSSRKLAEEALQKSEERFRNLFKTMAHGVVYQNSKGIITDANPAAQRILGISLDQMQGRKSIDPRWKAIHEDGSNFPGEEHPVMIALKTGKDVNNVIMGVYKPSVDEYRWINVNAILQFNPGENKPHQAYAIFEDITERKLAEEAIRESNEKYLNLMDSLGTGVVLHAPDTSIVLSNPKASEILGISSEQMEGKKAIDPRWRFVRNDGTDLPLEEYPVNKALSLMKSFSDYFIGIKRPDRKYITWVNVNASLVYDIYKKIKYVTISFNDTTEQKRAELALKESEAKLKALFASLTEMVVMHELVINDAGEAIDYRIIDCNTVFTELTGISKEDAIGKLASEVYQTNPPPYLEKYAKVALGGDAHEFNTYYPRLDKHFMISVVSPQAGTFATITTDISDMMQIQEMIIAKNKEMENYLYVASHDLRTPLVNIQGFSQRLKKQADSIKTLFADKTLEPEILHQLSIITDENIPKTLSFILGNIEKMDTLINGLLQLSRTGTVDMNIQKIDMNELFAKIIHSLDFQIKEAQCKIHIDPLPECYGDAALLDQLFANIISNALKYSDSERALEITVDAKKRHNRVVYTIRDTGKGIAQKHLDKIWDVFYRIDPRLGKSGEGIGLSLVKRIAEKHKGKVWVESEENKGSGFYIELNNRLFTEF